MGLPRGGTSLKACGSPPGSRAFPHKLINCANQLIADTQDDLSWLETLKGVNKHHNRQSLKVLQMDNVFPLSGGCPGSVLCNMHRPKGELGLHPQSFYANGCKWCQEPLHLALYTVISLVCKLYVSQSMPCNMGLWQLSLGHHLNLHVPRISYWIKFTQ